MGSHGRDDADEHGDRGSAVVWALALVVVILTASFVAAAVAQQAMVRQRVGSAADVAALAAAQSDGDPCAAAGRVAVANESTLVACAIDGLDVVVQVSRPAPDLVRRLFALLGSSPRAVVGVARAGPSLTEEGGPA
jgi:secretion/DNA translocation related TadE-like protein